MKKGEIICILHLVDSGDNMKEQGIVELYFFIQCCGSKYILVQFGSGYGGLRSQF